MVDVEEIIQNLSSIEKTPGGFELPFMNSDLRLVARDAANLIDQLHAAVIYRSWQPIDTAPVPARESLRYDHWPCLLQNRHGKVVGGFAAYRRLPGSPQDRNSWRIQWFSGDPDGPPSSARVFVPVYWMPMPAPKVKQPAEGE